MIQKLRLPVIFSGPYSYSTAPIEMLFGGLKNGTLLQYGDPTGKARQERKNLRVKLLGRRVRSRD